jgi:hypothetical protein
MVYGIEALVLAALGFAMVIVFLAAKSRFRAGRLEQRAMIAASFGLFLCSRYALLCTNIFDQLALIGTSFLLLLSFNEAWRVASGSALFRFPHRKAA